MSAQRGDVRIGDDETRGPSTDAGGGTLGPWGQLASVGVGGVLVAVGLGRRSLGGVLTALGGGWLVYQGLSGNRPMEAIAQPSPAAGRHVPSAAPESATAKRTVTIGQSPADVYEQWRDPETIRRVFGEFATVRAPAEDRLVWEIEGPLGWTTTWETQVVEEREGELIRWETTSDAPVSTAGTVRFRPAPGDRGTEVALEIRLDPPGGALGQTLVDRLGVVPDALAATPLRRFKSLVETGEMPTLEKNPSGRGRGDLV